MARSWATFFRTPEAPSAPSARWGRSSALDVTIQKQVVEEMALVRKTFGTAIVLVSHNLGVIGALADNVLVLKDGKCVEYGRCDQVLSNPGSAYAKALLSAVPRLRR